MSAEAEAGAAQRTVRSIISYLLLFALVVIAAVGLSGLLGRLLGEGAETATADVAGLARSLAFTLVGGPLAVLLWRVVWRQLGDGAERGSVSWGLYVTGAYLISLITAASSLLGALSTLIGGHSLQWRQSMATGLVWAAVWAWHRWMWRDLRKRPLHLAGVPAVLGAYSGLVIGTGGAVGALSALLAAALREATAAAVGKPWWVSVLQSLVWAVGGGLVWWWHWNHDGGRLAGTGFAGVALIAVGVLGPGMLTLSGAGITVFVLLRLLFDRVEAVELLLEPLAPAIAAAAIGSLIWVYHRGLARESPDTIRQGSQLVTSGVALLAAASGTGVIVNATLALAATPLAGSGARTLLFGGVSSLLVGGPVWWFVWKPLDRESVVTSGAAGDSGSWLNARRLYLMVVFGISAVVAVITLLVIGFRLFEYYLGEVTGGSLVDRIRAPLGLLAATCLAAGYHFAVWRRERAVPTAGGPARTHAIGHVVLVTGGDPAPLRRLIEDITGAGVTVWRRAGAGAAVAAPASAADAARLAGELQGVSGRRVLVTVRPDGTIDVIPLQD